MKRLRQRSLRRQDSRFLYAYLKYKLEVLSFMLF